MEIRVQILRLLPLAPLVVKDVGLPFNLLAPPDRFAFRDLDWRKHKFLGVLERSCLPSFNQTRFGDSLGLEKAARGLLGGPKIPSVS